MCRDLTTRVPRVDADKGLVDCYNVSPIWLVLVIIIQTTVHVVQEFTHNLLSAVHWQWFDDWSNSFEYWKNAFQELELFCKEDEHFIKYLLLMHYHRTPSVYPSKIFTVNSLPYDSPCVTSFLVWINLLFMKPPLCSTSSHLLMNIQLVGLVSCFRPVHVDSANSIFSCVFQLAILLLVNKCHSFDDDCPSKANNVII